MIRTIFCQAIKNLIEVIGLLSKRNRNFPKKLFFYGIDLKFYKSHVHAVIDSNKNY